MSSLFFSSSSFFLKLTNILPISLSSPSDRKNDKTFPFLSFLFFPNGKLTSIRGRQGIKVHAKGLLLETTGSQRSSHGKGNDWCLFSSPWGQGKEARNPSVKDCGNCQSQGTVEIWIVSINFQHERQAA